MTKPYELSFEQELEGARATLLRAASKAPDPDFEAKADNLSFYVGDLLNDVKSEGSNNFYDSFTGRNNNPTLDSVQTVKPEDIRGENE